MSEHTKMLLGGIALAALAYAAMNQQSQSPDWAQSPAWLGRLGSGGESGSSDTDESTESPDVGEYLTDGFNWEDRTELVNQPSTDENGEEQEHTWVGL